MKWTVDSYNKFLEEQSRLKGPIVLTVSEQQELNKLKGGNNNV